MCVPSAETPLVQDAAVRGHGKWPPPGLHRGSRGRRLRRECASSAAID